MAPGVAAAYDAPLPSLTITFVPAARMLAAGDGAPATVWWMLGIGVGGVCVVAACFAHWMVRQGGRHQGSWWCRSEAGGCLDPCSCASARYCCDSVTAVWQRCTAPRSSPPPGSAVAPPHTHSTLGPAAAQGAQLFSGGGDAAAPALEMGLSPSPPGKEAGSAVPRTDVSEPLSC
eukprot:TRINITY_DN18020_c0_g1_i1.p1 TRINITY_DN18020_c0_g1~~TRINITY_DN18020_c0_g1_i1.p1  ORF type:complete len:175 (+),score=12.76 TRINITY_DN18020_c0_g1_i1:74-598(+)